MHEQKKNTRIQRTTSIDAKTKQLIDKVAERVCDENGMEFEVLMKERQKTDAKFAFLFPNNKHNDYYERKKQEIEKRQQLSIAEISQFNQILVTLDGSRDCIKNGCFWILQHKTQIKSICKLIDTFIHNLPQKEFNTRLYVCYVINDVLHEVMGDRPNNNSNDSNNTKNSDDKLDAVSLGIYKMLLRILCNCYQNGNANDRSRLDSLLQLWQDRNIFSLQMTSNLQKSMKTPSNIANSINMLKSNLNNNNTNNNINININNTNIPTQQQQQQQQPLLQTSTSNTAATATTTVTSTRATMNAMQNALANLNATNQTTTSTAATAAAGGGVVGAAPTAAIKFNPGLPIPVPNALPGTFATAQIPVTSAATHWPRPATAAVTGPIIGMNGINPVAAATTPTAAVVGAMGNNMISGINGMPSFPTPVSNGMNRIHAISPFAQDTLGVGIGLITEIALELRRTGKGGIYVPLPVDKLPPFRKKKEEAVLEQERQTKNIPQVFDTYLKNIGKILKM